MLKTYTSVKTLKVCVHCTILSTFIKVYFLKIKTLKILNIDIQITHWLLKKNL